MKGRKHVDARSGEEVEPSKGSHNLRSSRFRQSAVLGAQSIKNQRNSANWHALSEKMPLPEYTLFQEALWKGECHIRCHCQIL